MTKHKAKVMSMCLTKFDEEVFVGRREEGKIQDRIESMFENRVD